MDHAMEYALMSDIYDNLTLNGGGAHLVPANEGAWDKVKNFLDRVWTWISTHIGNLINKLFKSKNSKPTTQKPSSNSQTNNLVSSTRQTNNEPVQNNTPKDDDNNRSREKRESDKIALEKGLERAVSDYVEEFNYKCDSMTSGIPLVVRLIKEKDKRDKCVSKIENTISRHNVTGKDYIVFYERVISAREALEDLTDSTFPLVNTYYSKFETVKRSLINLKRAIDNELRPVLKDLNMYITGSNAENEIQAIKKASGIYFKTTKTMTAQMSKFCINTDIN